MHHNQIKKKHIVMENICRNCGRKIEVGEGVFIEQDTQHCEQCHDLLYTKEEWDALYEEWNMDDDGTEGCGTCYYWTTMPESDDEDEDEDENVFSNFASRYNELEKDVKSELFKRISNSNIVSKHIVGVPSIEVNVYDYTELVVWDGDLVFIDRGGYHYGLYSECSLEDLIELLKP